MKLLPWLVTTIALLALLVSRPGAPSSPSAPPAKKESSAVGLPLVNAAAQGGRQAAGDLSDSSVSEVKGRTQAVPGRKALIAPVPLHPVVEVLVVPGQRVKKEQVLIKIDDDEAQADVRAKKALLESAGITLKESRRYFKAIETLALAGAATEASYYNARTAALNAEKAELAAKAALEAARAELEHYTVNSPIDGVVNWLDVHVGMVSRPGTTVWGEILDLSEIDVRCKLTPDQADRVTVGQAAEVRKVGKKDVCGAGKVVFVGIAADRTSGLVPVTVRLPNARGALRCQVPVQVRFTEALAVNGATK
jgi:RND family efflux transporter MFP subunit